MSLVALPYSFSPGETALSSQVNANFTELEDIINGNIDNTNIGAAGLFASNIIPLTTAEATFGGSTAYVFQHGINNLSGNIQTLFGVTAALASVDPNAMGYQNGGLYSATGIASGEIGLGSVSGAGSGQTQINSSLTAVHGIVSITSFWGNGVNVFVPADVATSGMFAPAYSFQRNKLINGAMKIDQRNNGALITPTNSQYSVDRWQALLTQAGKFQLQQTAVTPGSGPASSNELTATSTSAYAVVSTDTFGISQPIEADNISELDFGTAAAKPVTISFWVESSLTGTFGGAIQNYAQNRSYPFTFSIPVANTRTLITVTLPGDTGGTWVLSGAAGGMRLTIGLGSGSTFSGTAGAWVTGNIQSVTGAVSVVGTNAATFRITDVQLETGTIATPVEQRQFATELALCQRYCYNSNPANVGNATFAVGFIQGANLFSGVTFFPVAMRAAPTLTALGTASNYDVFAGNSAGNTISSLPTLSNASPTTCQISANLGTASTVGFGAELQGNNAGTPQLIYSAEL